MLNGIDPIIIFNFQEDVSPRLFNALSGIPLIGQVLAGEFGVRIPVYLSEELSRIAIDSESKAIDADTQVFPRFDGKPPEIVQSGINSTVTINFEAPRDSLMLTLLLALSDTVFRKLVDQKYSITYLNGSTTVFNRLFHAFSHATVPGTDLISGALTLSRANLEGTIPLYTPPTLEKVTAITPVS